jgi:hypothetical protein
VGSSRPQAEVLYFDGVFRTAAGIAGQPDERWVRDAFGNDDASGVQR